jgi:O-antigen ligase
MTAIAPAAPGVVPAAATAPAAHPVTRLARWRLTVVAIWVAMAALPLLRPSGPGNTGAADLAVVGAMLTAAMWASARLHVVRLPYAFPVGLTVLAGALAAAGAAAHAAGGARTGAISGAGWHSLLALAQDVFVFSWAAAVTTLGQDRALLDTLCRAWAYSAVVWACVLIVGEVAGLNWLTGINGRDGIRASLTLSDPNMAADYFICGLLVMRAARRPRRTGSRWLACALVLTAILLTLSNGGILALVGATVLGWLFGLARRRGVLVAAAAGVVLALAGSTVVASVDVYGWVTRVEESSPFIRDSLGRESESGGSRSALVHETAALWLRGDGILGIGPGNTEVTLRAHQAAYVKEAHDDYLAALLERGALGAVALLMLAAALVVRCRRISAAGGASAGLRDVVPRPELLAAAVAAIGFSALFYEVLHFRHVWALFGLVAALELMGRPQRGRPR